MSIKDQVGSEIYHYENELTKIEIAADVRYKKFTPDEAEQEKEKAAKEFVKRIADLATRIN